MKRIFIREKTTEGCIFRNCQGILRPPVARHIGKLLSPKGSMDSQRKQGLRTEPGTFKASVNVSYYCIV